MAYETIPPSTAIDPGTRETAGGDVQDLAVSGLTGDTDGDYLITGVINTPAASPEYTLYINGAAAVGGGSNGSFVTNAGTVVGLALNAGLYISSTGSPEVGQVAFWAKLTSRQDQMGAFACQAFWERASGTVCLGYNTVGRFTMTDQITSVGIHASIAANIVTGSWIRLQKLGFTA